MGFSRQGHWSGLPFPLPGDLPHPGIEPCAGRQILYHWATWASPSAHKPHLRVCMLQLKIPHAATKINDSSATVRRGAAFNSNVIECHIRKISFPLLIPITRFPSPEGITLSNFFVCSQRCTVQANTVLDTCLHVCFSARHFILHKLAVYSLPCFVNLTGYLTGHASVKGGF